MQAITVPLTDDLFEETHRLIRGVRQARRQPPVARVCRCNVCSRIEKHRVFEECRRRKDLTLISGIARKRAEILEEAGIDDYVALSRADPIEVAFTLSKEGSGGASHKEITGWIHHANALENNHPVFFGSQPLDFDDFIALDVEYDTLSDGSPVWLIGAAVVSNTTERTHSWWADPGEEQHALAELFELLSNHPRLPVVTWSGNSADLPALAKALKRAGRPDDSAKLAERHVDLFAYVKDSLRFPVESLKIKMIGAQLGLVRDPHISDGLDAVMAWHRYQRSIGTKRASDLKEQLVGYNRDDVAFLVQVTKGVSRLTQEHTEAAVV